MLLEQFSPGLRSEISTGSQRPYVMKIDARGMSADGLRRWRMEVASPSLFASVRFFYIRNIEHLPTALLKDTVALVEQVPECSKLVFVASKLPDSNPLVKLCQARETFIRLEELKAAKLRRWIEKGLEAACIRDYPKELLDLLVQQGEGSADKIADLIERLSLLAEDGKLSRHDLAAVLSLRTEQSEFELIDAIADKNSVRAQITLEKLSQAGSNPFILLSLIARNFGQYLRIKEWLRRGGSSAEVQDRLGLSPWLFNKQLKTANGRSLEQLKSSLINVLRADSKLKNKSLGTETILSELVDRL